MDEASDIHQGSMVDRQPGPRPSGSDVARIVVRDFIAAAEYPQYAQRRLSDEERTADARSAVGSSDWQQHRDWLTR